MGNCDVRSNDVPLEGSYVRMSWLRKCQQKIISAFAFPTEMDPCYWQTSFRDVMLGSRAAISGMRKKARKEGWN